MKYLLSLAISYTQSFIADCSEDFFLGIFFLGVLKNSFPFTGQHTLLTLLTLTLSAAATLCSMMNHIIVV
jgi:hypothetical protein